MPSKMGKWSNCMLCNIAKKRKIKVILGGDGVDEYFCGYNSFFKSLYKKIFMDCMIF